ncbi:RHS repeat domain-containing protein [Planctomycetes bacterium TBK1r]|uniref:tRNA3(Ser)-specific nuclease WapA n=1 Tax=Stieleria magnilauensis TaxID=2527963 RepID=A0ABX5XQI1_9BACT|nr:tRNA3(Ser)-specific nuclease WapA precursor [Planctomycetes bacterium TBK1r]
MLCHRSSRRQNLRQRLARTRARGVKPCADLNSNRSCKTLRQPTCSPGKSRPENDRPSIKFTVRYLRGQQYSINALTDSSGTIKERYAYDAYGGLSIFDAAGTARTTTAEGNRYTYTGREYDDVLDLYHHRARMYDSIAGRFCSRDPIGFMGSPFNLYEYVSAMPLSARDPSGLVGPGDGGAGGWPGDPFIDPKRPRPSLPDVPAGGAGCMAIAVPIAVVEPTPCGEAALVVIVWVTAVVCDKAQTQRRTTRLPKPPGRPFKFRNPFRSPRVDPGYPPPNPPDRDDDKEKRCPEGECWCCVNQTYPMDPNPGSVKSCSCRDAEDCWLDGDTCSPYDQEIDKPARPDPNNPPPWGN